MKISLLLSLSLLFLASCQKLADITPEAKSKTPISTPTAIATAKLDTIPDNALMKIALVKDSSNYDETALFFNHKASPKYSSSNDAPYFPGFGQVSFSSISSDGIDLAINQIPYTDGMSIGLDVHAKTDGAYFIKLSYQKNIPATMQVWVMDKYLKDSVNVCTKIYKFKVATADTNSFGTKRFRLVFKDVPHQ